MRLKAFSYVLKAGSLFTVCGAALVALGVALASKFPEIRHEMNWSTNTTATLVVVVGTALWIMGGSHDRVITPLISVRPLTLIGDCSYSIYLLHWPIWVLLIKSLDQNTKTIVIALTLSLSLGWFQFRFIEEPIRSRKKLASAKTAQFVGVFGLVAAVGFVSMSYLTPVLGMHLAGKKPDEISLHIIEKPCAGQLFDLESAHSCVFSSPSNSGSAILVGDSMAKSLSDGFVQASNAQGLNGYVFSYPGCAFQLFDSPFSATNECIAWRTDVMSALQQLQPKVLIIANLNSLYVENPLPDWSIADTQQIWGTQLSRALESLASLHTQVIIVQPPPRFAYDLRYDLSLLWPNSVMEPRGVVVARRETINAIEEKAIEGFKFVQPIVNFTNQFCDVNICNPQIKNEFMLEDDDHLSVDGSFLVEGQLQGAMRAALGL